VALVLVLAFAFGALASLAKGSGDTISEVRAALGNLSTPWLLVPFLAGASGTKSSRLGSGALLGLLATMIALTGFYFVGTLLQDLGGHGFFRDLQLELSANKGYLEGGLVTGPLFGALGVWWRRTRTLRASVVAGALLMAEPLVLLAVGAYGGGVLPRTHGLPEFVRIVPGWGLSGDSGSTAIAVYAAEFALGLGVLLFAVLRRPGRKVPA